MARRCSPIWGAVLPGAVLVVLALSPAGAAACSIDNRASLYANGVQASITTGTPNPGAVWATFTVEKAFARDAAIQFSESQAELARSLPQATVAAPYRWSFGDGATALGHTVTHRYARPGLYRLIVSAVNPGTHFWYTFDNALVRIVPPDQVMQDNLGYYALRVLDIAMSSLGWIVDALLILLVVFAVIRRRGGRHARPAGTEHV